MKNYVTRVDNILKMNGQLLYDFGRFSKIYLMTTENIKDFLNQYTLTDNNVLTVAGSGDQVLNAYLMGAKNVTCFDINPLAFFQVNLKKAAVSTLNYQDYIDFFFGTTDNNKFLSYSIFEKFYDVLDKDTADFWSYLYSNHHKDIFNKIYYHFIPNLDNMKRMNAYLEEDNYEKLSLILKNKDISFIESDVTCLDEKLDNNYYDMILLSNISESINNIWPINYLNNFKNVILSLANHLTPYGTIQVGYIYDYYNPSNFNAFSIKKQRQEVFTTDSFHTSFVGSFIDSNKKDAIVTYQKRKF